MRQGQITIGLFDSGVGGLSVLRQLESHFATRGEAQSYRFLYLGDTARLPYGNRSSQEIKTFVEEIVAWLSNKGADQIVMACNTSAALAYSTACAQSKVPVYDLIKPTAEHLTRALQGKQKIGVLATNSTVKSQAFSKAIKEFSNDCEVVEIGCPELVGIVESGQINSEETKKTLSKYASQLEKAGVDSVVLGCTHYPFLAGPLSALLPSHVQLVDPAALMVRSLSKNKTSTAALNETARDVEIKKEIYVTGPLADFATSAEICLGQAPGTIYGITIQDLQAARTEALQANLPVADISGALS